MAKKKQRAQYTSKGQRVAGNSNLRNATRADYSGSLKQATNIIRAYNKGKKISKANMERLNIKERSDDKN